MTESSPKFSDFGTLLRAIADSKLCAEVGMSRLAALFAVVLVSLTTLAIAQGPAPSSNSGRKVVTRVAADYPELARRMSIRGVVKVEAMVRPNGTVKSARVVGGNPVLVDSAVAAVEKWKFEPAPTETTELVQLIFGPQ